jgi:hypothetical protein
MTLRNSKAYLARITDRPNLVFERVCRQALFRGTAPVGGVLPMKRSLFIAAGMVVFDPRAWINALRKSVAAHRSVAVATFEAADA